MNSGEPGARPWDVVRYLVLASVIAAPWAIGAVHPPAYIALLAVAYAAGLLSWARSHWARAHGEHVPKVPGRRWLLALLALTVLQLVPMPVALMRWISPGAHRYYDFVSLLPLAGWRPASVDPDATILALTFFGGMALLYAFAFREFANSRWRRRVAIALVASAGLMTLEALVQARSADPKSIYGLYKPYWDWAVFGPYINKNHFGGLLAMAFPLAVTWSLDALRELRNAWTRRRRGWLALGDPVGQAWLRRTAVVVVLLVGLLASRSRGAVLAAVVASLTAPVLLRRSRALALGYSALVVAGFVFVGGEELGQRLARGVTDSRLGIWRDALRMSLDFPVLGSGFNTFGFIFRRYKTVQLHESTGQAHNDYLQSLTDGGVVGLLVVAGLLLVLLRRSLAGAGSSVLGAGLLGSVIASCAHAFVEFNWQIPANAGTFAVLAGLAVQAPVREARHRLDPPRPGP